MRSAARVAADPEFHYVMEDMESLRKKLDDNRISLNEDVRRKETDEEKLRKETRTKERLARNQEEPSIYRLTLETVDKPESGAHHVSRKNCPGEKQRRDPKSHRKSRPIRTTSPTRTPTRRTATTPSPRRSIRSATRR